MRAIGNFGARRPHTTCSFYKTAVQSQRDKRVTWWCRKSWDNQPHCCQNRATSNAALMCAVQDSNDSTRYTAAARMARFVEHFMT